MFGYKNKIKFRTKSPGNFLSEKWTFCQTKKNSNLCSILFDLETLNFTTQMSFVALKINGYCYVKLTCICAWICRDITIVIGDWKRKHLSCCTQHKALFAGNWRIVGRQGNAVVAGHAIGDIDILLGQNMLEIGISSWEHLSNREICLFSSISLILFHFF